MNPLIGAEKKILQEKSQQVQYLKISKLIIGIKQVKSAKHTIARRSGINPDRPFSMSGTLVPRKTKLMSEEVVTAS